MAFHTAVDGLKQTLMYDRAASEEDNSLPNGTLLKPSIGRGVI